MTVATEEKQKVTVYSKPGCKYCIETKTWLDMNEIEYDEVNVVGNKEGLHTIKENGFRMLPVVSINDFEIAWSGHQKDNLEGHLKNS